MRNLKKFLALVLAMMMMLSVAVISTSAASDDADYTEAAQRLAALQVMKGNENGDLMLGNGVTRYQAALFFVQALTGETDVAVWNAEKKSAHFADVPEYGTAIDYAYGINLIKGRGNGVYGYNDAISYQDMLVMAVRALGYETADMSYPYGYILAAQKLGLTENVDLVNYKAALNRGETAQIIWDMLDTEVAVIDPLTDKVLYPGETGLTDALLGQNGQPVTERETLMESSDLAGDKIDAVIIAFNEADEDDEEDVDTVVISSADLDANVEIAAADLGITADTAKVNYKGLPVEIYIDVDAVNFDQDAYDDEEAAIVFATAPSYTSVLNLGDGNVKFVENEDYPEKSYFSFGGTKFAVGKYAFSVAVFDADNAIWAWNVTNYTADDLATIFAYDAEEDLPYVNGENTFGQVSYRETDEIVVDNNGTPDDTTDDAEYTLVEVLYTPLSFGQYNVREINDVKYPVIASYEDAAVTNLDEVSSNFVEYLVGYNKQVNVNTTKITNKQGEKALSVTMAGEAVEAGDFMFYAYNAADNVLTVAKTFGDFETGRLTAKTTSKQTVKISGTNYEFGFDGFNPDFADAWDDYAADIQGYIEDLEAGMDNVKYLVVNGKIVYMEACTETTNDSYFDFAFVSTDAELLQDLLDLSDAKFEDAYTADVIVNEDGYMTVAVLNLETGKWELASIKAVEYNWDDEDEEFAKSADPATLASYIEMFEDPTTYGKYDAYVKALEVVAEGLVAVVEEKDGVYTIASRTDSDNDFFVSGATDTGLLFSDNNSKTNAITADDDVDAERVTLNDESVIVVFDGVDKVAGARVGVQGADDSITVVSGEFLAASSKLIVLVATEGLNIDVAEWDGGSASSGLDEVYYITTVDTGAELENNEEEEDSFIITLTNLYNLNTNEMVDSIQVVVESATDDLADIEGANILLKAEGDEIAEATETLAEIILAIANDKYEGKEEYAAVDFTGFDFESVDTIFVKDVMETGEAVDVEVNVVTLNFVTDAEDLDFDNVVLNKVWNEGDEENVFDATDVEFVDELVYWSFELNLDEDVAEINEPTEGVFDNYALEAATNGVLVATADGEDFVQIGVDYTAVAVYEDGVVYITVYRVLTDAE